MLEGSVRGLALAVACYLCDLGWVYLPLWASLGGIYPRNPYQPFTTLPSQGSPQPTRGHTFSAFSLTFLLSVSTGSGDSGSCELMEENSYGLV